ncbi:Sigma-70 (plasmid) [Trichormus variabilis ATCC 29413]|uniref:Sigma-70 n=2 Tax=Anabaena variabilis TaxID=264691 RepID=Q3M2G3_TRIV2|nr:MULTISPECIES: RpoD/SigA family RNA polymerase sigma factor [Nostocaceae]ABA24823.1 Sigma-70 [Trichormus variabilis ATCC 29413]MBC1217988.1 RpoD/SigA family RNA polymerase sigma factor [Trichormus variabilis ARAD]MBC1259097.1 RpoD/SigA family RNA polymerase sigma factor [Trichormus variabilis V5]MBC1270641.1 RpoD/SigA family RNA polymerase sigma factor [Trichormus variabilis FSR]MBC1305495.1 RpoD/SigA family RNA polymerase sigma factor [Trichormus variabilis N2B]
MSPQPDSVGIYLREISKYPMLTPEQEITLARQVKQMTVVQQHKQVLEEQLHQQLNIQQLAADMGKSETEVFQILRLGQKAKEKMIAANLRLVVAIAKKYRWSQLEFLDLVQEGSIGLQKAVERFDPNRGYKFSTCAYWWIRQEITKAIANKSTTIRTPSHMNDRLIKLKKVQRELVKILGREPNIAEIAEFAELEPNQVRECLIAFRHPLSLDRPMGQEDEVDFLEILPADGTSPNEYLDEGFLRQDLANCLITLKPLQKQVLMLRFGLGSVDKLSTKQIAERLNIKQAKVGTTQKQAIKVLHRQQPQMREYLA